MTFKPLKGLRVAVAGAGVLGLSTAVLAARRGAEVVVFDPAARGDNASGVAAGMLSPVLEAVLEGDDGARHVLFERAYGEWGAFAAEMRLPVAPNGFGSISLGETMALGALADRLGALGLDFAKLDAAGIRARQPLYGGDKPGLLIMEETRVDPVPTLDALLGVLADEGGALASERLEPRVLPAAFDRLVIATGYDAHLWRAAAPELACLTPIKGHILHFTMAGAGGPTLRGVSGYLAPQTDRVAFGATMEAGRNDRTLDPAVAADLRAQAIALAPALMDAPWVARAGVRAATPDGLPLVGLSEGGSILAVGARRNGWLLAPLVAKAAVAALEGALPEPVFDPARFRTA